MAEFYSSTHQILKRANEGRAQTALVQVFGVAQVDDLVDQLQKKFNHFVIKITTFLPRFVPNVHKQANREGTKTIGSLLSH